MTSRTGASGPHPVDPIDRAHLTGVSRPSPPIHRYGPSEHLVDLVERYWIPVWSLAEPSTQSTLQHPVCLVVVSNTYARFYGVSRGRSSVTLEGDGWAVGTMLSPAAGRLVLGRSVAEVTDTWVELGDLVPDPAVVDGVRAAMEDDPHDPAAHLAAVAHVESWLATPPAGRRVRARWSTGWSRGWATTRRSPGSTTWRARRGCPSAASSGWWSSASG